MRRVGEARAGAVRSAVAMFVGVVVLGGFAAGACGDDDESSTPSVTPGSGATATTVVGSPTAVAGDFIRIDEPPAGASVGTPIEVRGTADVFEAALTLDALDAAGATLCERHIMATSGTGTPGTWETTLAVPPPDAAQEVMLRAYSFSAMDGSMINLVERPVALSAERPAIFILSPACGTVVAPGGTLTVTGRALVFEAVLRVELRDASGTAVVSQQVMAASGTEESDFTTTLAIPATLPSGFYDLAAFDYSARDGAIENEYTVQVVVEP